MGLRTICACVLLAMAFQTLSASSAWLIKGVGDVQYAHFYYEENTLQGICVASADGVIALLEQNTGEILWRDSPVQRRSTSKFVAEGKYVFLVSDNSTKVELYDLALRQKVNTVLLSQDPGKPAFTDVHFVNASKENLTYIVMSNSYLTVFENKKEKMKAIAKKDETFVFTGYDNRENIVIVGSTQKGASVLTNRAAFGKSVNFTLKFDQYKDIILKTSQYLLIVKTPPNYESTVILTHHIESKGVIFNHAGRTLGDEFEVKKFVLPSNLVIFKSSEETVMMVFEELEMKEIKRFRNEEGEYGFGANKGTTKAYMCRSNETGYTIYEVEPGSEFKTVYQTETDITRRLYGEPEVIWADTNSSRILLKTSDRSLHMILGSTKQWTQRFGLSQLRRLIIQDNMVIALNSHSKVVAIDREKGVVSWERAAMGFLADMQIVCEKGAKTLGLMIHAVSEGATRLVEVFVNTGEKANRSKHYSGFQRLIFGNEGKAIIEGKNSSSILLSKADRSVYLYPDFPDTREALQSQNAKISYFMNDVTKTIIVRFKLNNDSSKFVWDWNISFASKHETILGYKKMPEGMGEHFAYVSGKQFPYIGNFTSYFVVLTRQEKAGLLHLHLIDSQDGTILSSVSFPFAMPDVKPTLLVNYPHVAVGLHYPSDSVKSDKVMLVDFCLLAETASVEGQANVGSLNLERGGKGFGAIFPVQTTLDLAFKYVGIDLVDYEASASIVAVSEDYQVKIVKLAEISRGGIVTPQFASTLLPEGVMLKHPANLTYEPASKTLIVQSIDMCLTTVPQ